MNSFSPLSKIRYEVADTSSVCQSGRAANFRHESPVELPKDRAIQFFGLASSGSSLACGGQNHMTLADWDASTVMRADRPSVKQGNLCTVTHGRVAAEFACCQATPGIDPFAT